MKKINTIVLSVIFSASIALAQEPPKVIKGKPEIKTDLSGLKTAEGKPVNADLLKNKIALIYFGTAYKSPSCESFFGTQGLALDLLKKSCPDIGNTMKPIFICPYVSDAENESNIKQAQRFGFTVLRGDLKTVLALAKKYNVQYFDADRDGTPENHTNYMYLQNMNGENIVILHGGLWAAQTAAEISKALKKDGFAPARECGFQ